MPDKGQPFAILDFRWHEIVEALGERIIRGAPEVRGRRVKFKGDIVAGGVRIELYDEQGYIESLAPAALVRAAG